MEYDKPTNAHRGELAAYALDTFAEHVNPKAILTARADNRQMNEGDIETLIQDLVADLGHLANGHDLDFLAIAERGIGCWSAEQRNPNAETNDDALISIDRQT